MAALKDKLRGDLTAAMKARDQVRTRTLRMALTSLAQEEVAGPSARELSDDEVIKVLTREAKRRREAAEAFASAGRDDQAAAERAEGVILGGYLPTQLSDEEVAAMVAAAIDHVLLLAIDAGVIYFTLRISGLTMNEWGALPVLPLLAFLLLLKLAYFSAFTAVGGQTIGKMALRIRVVSEDNGAIDGNLALKRTVVSAVSTAFLGLGLLPAFFDPERRAFHDRVARTRVVGLRTA